MSEFFHSDFLTILLYVLGTALAWHIWGLEKSTSNNFEKMCLSLLWPLIAIISMFVMILGWLFDND